VSWGLIVPFALLSGLAAATIGFFVMRVRRRPSVAGREAMLGSTVEALENIDGEGWVRADGERWRARSRVPLARGAHARIVALDGLTLVVDAAEKGERS
jgi:membrane-bound serine protease (ClpP class)